MCRADNKAVNSLKSLTELRAVKFFGKCIFSKWLSRATSIIVDNLLEMLYNIRVVKKQKKEI